VNGFRSIEVKSGSSLLRKHSLWLEKYEDDEPEDHDMSESASIIVEEAGTSDDTRVIGASLTEFPDPITPIPEQKVLEVALVVGGGRH